jgi:hypothetical protein
MNCIEKSKVVIPECLHRVSSSSGFPLKIPLYGSAFQNPARLNFGCKGAESKKREMPYGGTRGNDSPFYFLRNIGYSIILSLFFLLSFGYSEFLILNSTF